MNDDVKHFKEEAKEKYGEQWNKWIEITETSVTIKKCLVCNKHENYMKQKHPRWYGNGKATNTTIYSIHCSEHSDSNRGSLRV